MNKKSLLKHLIFLMFFIFILNNAGVKLHLDYTTWWFDMVLHFLSGFWVGLFFIYVFLRKTIALNPSLKVFVNVMLCVLSIVLAWEVFEFYVNNMIGLWPFDTVDTTSDIFLGLGGGLLSLFYFFKTIIPKCENAVE